jgi:hypothetical protein
MRAIIVAAVISLGLAGCQTVAESQVSAEYSCQNAGLRPGTRAYARCVNQIYAENRINAQEASNAVAAGVAAGVIGGAIVAASTPRYGYYGRGYYGRGYYGRGYYGRGYYY